ncbi:unnamed protein product [Ectocarpus sp. CCAP 1310/34]|nr:unnamed protein product [Ectocarpus sp. CCAP 1310/34]
MVAATVRPGRPRSININDLHVSLGHTNDANARETAKQLGIQVTGTRGYCAGCGEAKAIRRSVPKETKAKAGRPFGRVFIDLTGPYPPSTGGARYCMMVVDDYSNVGWTLFLADKGGSTLCDAFRAWYVDTKQLAGTHGGLGVARFDNGTEFTNTEFRHLLSELGVAVEFTPVDGAKRNGRAERKIALVVEGGKAAWLEFPRLFPDLEFPRKAMAWTTIWPKALAWMNDTLNMTAQAHTPDKLCPWEKLYKRRATTLPLPFMMPGFRHRNRKNKTESKGERCFYLNTGNNHSSTTHKILLSSGVCSYSADVTWGYRRAPFVGEVPTWGGGAVVEATEPFGGLGAATGAAGAAVAPAAGVAAPGSSVFPAAAVGETAGGQALAAGAAASAAAPAAGAAAPGSSGFPAAAVGETAGVQTLAAGAAASAAAPAAGAAALGRSVFPPAAVGEAAGAQALAAGTETSTAAGAAGAVIIPTAGAGVAAGTEILSDGAAAPVVGATAGDPPMTAAVELDWADIYHAPPERRMTHRQQHEVTPAVTRSGSRRTGMPGAFALLAADEQMTRSLSGPTADIDDPALPNGLVPDLETPETYKQAHAGPHDVIWRAAERKEIAGLSAAGTFETMAAGE